MRDCYQVEGLENNLKARMYEKLHEASEKTNWVRLSGPLVGVASGLMTIAARVATIGECLFKGIGNLFGAPFTDRCSLGFGIGQLLIGVPINIIALPFSIAWAVTGLFVITIGMAAMPEGYTNYLWGNHEYNKHFI
jgi:hypothetical protein